MIWIRIRVVNVSDPPADKTEFKAMPSKQTVELRSPDGSAECLLAQREYFEKDGVSPAGVGGNVLAKLKASDDRELSEKLYNRNEEISKLVSQFLHCN